MNTPDNFTGRLRWLMFRDNLTRRELAERTGVHINTIGKLWRGEVAEPNTRVLKCLCDTFSVDAAFLLGQTKFHPLRDL